MVCCYVHVHPSKMHKAHVELRPEPKPHQRRDDCTPPLPGLLLTSVNLPCHYSLVCQYTHFAGTLRAGVTHTSPGDNMLPVHIM